MTADAFWNRVRKLLKEKKSTQKTLAEYLDLSLRTLENWMSRGIYPILPEGYKIAMFLGVSIEFLVTGKKTVADTNIERIRFMLKQIDQKLVNFTS